MPVSSTIFDDKEGLAAMNAEAQRDGGTVGLAPLVSQGMGELDGIVEQEGEGLDGRLLVGDNSLRLGLG